MPSTRRHRPSSGRAVTSGVALGGGLGLGLAAGLISLAPWLISGSHLPAQDLALNPSAPLPWTALPLSQYSTTLVLGLLAPAGILAGLFIRWWNPQPRTRVLWSAAAGIVLIQSIAAVQTLFAVAPLLHFGTLRDWYLTGLVGGMGVLVALGVAVLFLVGRSADLHTALGVGLGAVPLAVWLGAMVAAFSGLNPAEAGTLSGNGVAAWIIIWAPGLIAGLGLAVIFPATAGRILVWVTVLAWLWIAPFIDGLIATAIGTRLVRGSGPEILSAARDRLADSLPLPPAGLWPLLIAVTVGFAGWYLLTVFAANGPRRRASLLEKDD